MRAEGGRATNLHAAFYKCEVCIQINVGNPDMPPRYTRPSVVPHLELSKLAVAPGSPRESLAHLSLQQQQLLPLLATGSSWEDEEAELAMWSRPPCWYPAHEGSWFVYKPVSSKVGGGGGHGVGGMRWHEVCVCIQARVQQGVGGEQWHEVCVGGRSVWGGQ